MLRPVAVAYLKGAEAKFPLINLVSSLKFISPGQSYLVDWLLEKHNVDVNCTNDQGETLVATTS